MIYDFYGVPGVGKTFIVDELNRTQNISKTNSHVGSDFIKKIIKKMMLCSPYSLCSRWKIHGILKPYLKNSPLFFDGNMRCKIREILYLAGVYKYYKGTMYIEEGLVHRAISLAVNYQIPKEILYELIVVFHGVSRNVKTFYLDESVEVCIEAIKIRNRKACNMDQLSGDMLRKYLETFHDYCEYVNSCLGNDRISRANAKEIVMEKKC